MKHFTKVLNVVSLFLLMAGFAIGIFVSEMIPSAKSEPARLLFGKSSAFALGLVQKY